MNINIKEKVIPTCRFHPGEKLVYLCLDEKFTKQRMACRMCVQDHPKNKFGIIDKLVEPLSLLKRNSLHSSAQADHHQLKECMELIFLEWEKIVQIMSRTISQIQDGFISQMQMLLDTFTQQKIDTSFEVLRQPEPDTAMVDAIVKQVNFLNKDCFGEVEQIKKYSHFFSKKVKTAISKVSSQVEKMMKKLLKKIKVYDFSKMEHYEINEDADDISSKRKAEEKEETKAIHHQSKLVIKQETHEVDKEPIMSYDHKSIKLETHEEDEMTNLKKRGFISRFGKSIVRNK